MKAKDIATQLGNLAAATYGSYNNGIDVDIPDELAEPDPIFVVEHDSILKNDYEKAVKSVKFIVNTIVPESYQDNSIIKDKIEQDAEQLGQLYYQQNMNNIMIKAIMDTIAKGDTTAKIFDSYTKLMAMAKDINKQITELQNQFRKYYIDTYLDLQHKEDEDQIIEGNGVAKKKEKTITNVKTQELTYEPSDDELERRETSTRDSVLKVNDWKRQQFKEQYEQSLKNKED